METANRSAPGIRASRASAIVVQRVPPGAEGAFVEWQNEATHAAESFDGYTGTDIFPPSDERTHEWVTLIHFENQVALDHWLASPERARRVAELLEKIGDFEIKELAGGFGPWFAREDHSAGSIPSWKMALTVLLALFPTVMLLTIFVGPLTAPLGLAFSMLIGNALSISILQWGVMPLLTRWLDPWLTSGNENRWASAPAVILASLIGLAIGFRLITG